MITLQTLRTLLSAHLVNNNGVPYITAAENQVITGEGYDGIIAMIQNQLDIFPVVVLETNSTGSLRALSGGFDEYSQSIWIMDYAENGSNAASIYANMYRLAKKIIGILRYYSRQNPLHPEYNQIRAELKSIDWEKIPYFQRSGGANYFGYEIMLNQEEDIDLSWQP